MEIRATTDAPGHTGADTIVVGVYEGRGVSHDLPGGELTALLDSGEARTGFRKLAHTHADGTRWIVIGLGDREQFDPERARVAAATALGRARELGTKVLCWELPHHVTPAHAQAIAEGTALAAYSYTAWKSGDDGNDRGPGTLIVSAHDDVAEAVALGAVAAAASNAARDLGNAPANEMTPERLAVRARQLAEAHPALTLELWGRDEIEEAAMGAFASVARGSDNEPQLICLRYDPPEPVGPRLGLVGKAVTFDTGGYSLKPAGSMVEMKFDMCGGAAVLEATGAIAALAIPVPLIAVVGATENMVSGRASRPGDIVTSRAGVTIEINNTDAEGRLVLADCLTYAREQGAERLVDLATLTGAMVVALGSTYVGMMGTDDPWCDAVAAAGAAAGERVWRLPLDPEYAELIKGRYADIVNTTQQRKAGSIAAAEFLHRFVGDVPWAHLDIAGVAYDAGRAYAGKGASGWGVRLLIELARASAAAA